MIRRGYTLIEIIITIAITGILSVGMFKAFEAITLRSEKAKILATLSIDSQSALDQISLLLYDRVPASVRSKNTLGTWQSLDIDDTNFTAIEWWGQASESYQTGAYSSFVDMYDVDTNKTALTIYTPQTTKNAIENNQSAKWGSFTWESNNTALVFSQSRDQGDLSAYTIKMDGDNKIIFTNTPPDTLYEKYTLVDSAYTVTRGEYIVQSAACITALGKIEDINNTLFLFYNYRPWNGESFCADTVKQDGNVSILATNVNDFRASDKDGTIRLKINMHRTVRGGNPVRLSKQKVVF